MVTAVGALEPGGQFGFPVRHENLHQTCAETNRHLNHLRAATAELDLGMLGVGFVRWRVTIFHGCRRGATDHAQSHAEGRQPRA